MHRLQSHTEQLIHSDRNESAFSSSWLSLYCVCAILPMAMLASCGDHNQRARRLLDKAVVECRVGQGVITFEGTSDDPKYDDRREGVITERFIYVAAPQLPIEMRVCVDNVLGDGGYRMSVLKTDFDGESK